jgi:hypothetical protein
MIAILQIMVEKASKPVTFAPMKIATPHKFAKVPWLPGLAVLAALLGAVPARATVFNWNSAGTWTAGTPTVAGVTQSFTGLSVNLKDSVAGTVWQNGSNGVGPVSPGINNTLLTDHLTGQNALQLAIFSQPSTTAMVTVTVTFTTPVTGVSFNLWDVDKDLGTAPGNATNNSYEDLISNIKANLSAGGTVAPTSITDGGSDGTDNTSAISGGTGTIAGSSVTGGNGGGGTANDGLNSGQATINIGASTITSFTFEWSNPGWISGDGSQQFIALGNINYTAVVTPEIHSGYAALALCGGFIGVGSIYQRRRARSLQIALD